MIGYQTKNGIRAKRLTISCDGPTTDLLLMKIGRLRSCSNTSVESTGNSASSCNPAEASTVTSPACGSILSNAEASTDRSAVMASTTLRYRPSTVEASCALSFRTPMKLKAATACLLCRDSVAFCRSSLTSSLAVSSNREER